MKDDFMEIIAALNNIIYISDYITNKDKKYKKYKKRIEKMLQDTEDGYFVNYLDNPELYEDEGD